MNFFAIIKNANKDTSLSKEYLSKIKKECENKPVQIAKVRKSENIELTKYSYLSPDKLPKQER